MNEGLVENIRHQFESAQEFLVVSHIRPDGDAVGSLLGLGLSLQEAGKKVQMVLGDYVPHSFRHLPGTDEVRRKPSGEVDYIIVLDCSDLDRVGSALEGFGQPDLNIDHHPTNLNFAKINMVNVGAVSTTEILAENLSGFGLPLTKDVGEALLTGLITDTLGFRTSNMTSKPLRIAADLVDLGLPLPELYAKALIDRSFEALRYWGKGLSRMQREDRIVWTALTLDDREEVNYPGRDDADLVSVLSSIHDVDISVIFIEQPNSKVKVSWRARPGFDTSQIALIFGGGGHKAASGAEVEGTLEEVQMKVLQFTKSLLK